MFDFDVRAHCEDSNSSTTISNFLFDIDKLAVCAANALDTWPNGEMVTDGPITVRKGCEELLAVRIRHMFSCYTTGYEMFVLFLIS